MKPLCIDLFCGLGGWTEGFLAEGYRVVGFDIEVRPYPAQLVIQDVLTIHGSQFKDAAVIVASPPCQTYSWLSMPWSKSDAENCRNARETRAKWLAEGPDNRLFDACFRIQQEAIEATRRQCMSCGGGGVQDFPFDDRDCIVCEGRGYCERFIPLIVENVRGAQEWVGRSRFVYRSFHLWGDVPALMVRPSKDGIKQGGDWFGVGENASLCRRYGSKSPQRKAESARIAKIPLPLAQHIAAVYRPRLDRAESPVSK